MTKSILCPRCKLPYNVKEGKNNKKPLLLNCGHTFCESCLVQLWKERKISVVCPECLGDTLISEEEGGVQNLPVDKYMVGQVLQSQRDILDSEIKRTASVTMVQRKKVLSGEELCTSLLQSQDKDCKECLRKPATSYCSKCDCNMCASCFTKVHSLSKTLQSHKPQPLPDESQLEVSQMCKDHETRPLEYFCEDDGAIICSRCVIVGSHKGHNISSIEDKNRLIVNEMEPNLQMANHVFRRLKRIDKDIAGLVPDCKREIGPALDEDIAGLVPDCKREIGPALDQVGKHFQYLHGVLQIREKQLQQKIMDVYKTGIEPIEKLRLDLQKEYRQLDSAIKAAHRIMNNNDEIIFNAKEILDKLIRSKDIPCILEPCTDTTTSEKIGFLPGQSIDTVILDHGDVHGYLAKRFEMFTMKERPEKFTEDKESLGTSTPTDSYSIITTPFDSCSVSSATSEDVIIEDVQDIILDDTASRKSDSSVKGTRTALKPKQKKRSALTKSKARSRVEDVIVTHITSPRSFYVQFKRDSSKLSALSYSLQQWCNSQSSSKHRPDGVDVDDIVLAKYSADNQWYRSRIKQVIPPADDEPFEKTLVEVVYLDFGNIERVQVSNLRNMQNKFMRHPEFGVECCLVDLLPRSKDGVWPMNAVKTFAQIVENKILEMTVIREINNILHVDLSKPADTEIIDDRPVSVIREINNILHVDLSKPADTEIIDDRPVSVRDALVFMELANLESPNSLPAPRAAPAPSRNYITPEPLEEGIMYDVQVSFSGTPDHFYVQELGEEYEYLQNLTQELQSTYSHKMKDSWQILCPFIGMICVAQFSGDEMWYRARIIDMPGNREVKVHFVDFGNVETTDVFKLRKILDSFLILPAQAIVCRLADVVPHNANEGWSDESLLWWTNMVTMQRFSMKIVDIDPAFHVVLRQPHWPQSDSVNLKMVAEKQANSVGKWSAPPNIEVEDSLSQFVPRLSYQTGEGSFPELAGELESQPVYWKSRQPRPTRKYQETILTPPTSPVSKPRPSSNPAELKHSLQDDLVDVVSVLQLSPHKHTDQTSPNRGSPRSHTGSHSGSYTGSHTGVNGSSEKQPMDISPVQTPKKGQSPHRSPPASQDSGSVTKKSHKPKQSKKQTEDVEVVISNYVAPSEFYLQVAYAGRAGLNDLMKEMEKAYRNSEIEMISFKQGNYCAVLSPTDGQWYRGKIKKVLQKNLMEVFMLDYGFTEIVTTSNLRNILRQFRKERAFSFCCHLADLIPAGGMNEWSKTAIDLMRSEIQGRKLYLHKRGDVVKNSLPVDLVIEKYVEESALEPGRRTFVSLIELMKERGLAIRKTKKDSEKTKGAKTYPVCYYKKAEATVKDGDNVMPVYVDFDAVIHCYTMEGDDQFQSMCDTLDQKFKNSEPHGSEQAWEKGQACAAFYEKDQQWHRVSVVQIEPTKIQIHFIDYGNTEWVDYDQLRADIEEFIDIPQQTFLCMLHDIKPLKESGRWDVNVLDFMHKELVNKYCKITVIEKNGYENEHMTVNLEINNKDFGGVLVQYGMAKRGSYITDQEQQSTLIETVLNKYNPYKRLAEVTVGGMLPVIVTHVELPNLVYLQNTPADITDDMTEREKKHVTETNEYLNKLEQLSVDLNKAAPRLPVIFSPKVGLPCCAQFGFDQCYYRAVIIDIYPDTEQLLVLYVDYGNSEMITQSKMRALPPKYLSLPCQSMRCRLSDVERPTDTAVSWTKTALYEMMQVLANKQLIAKITSQNPTCVELLDPSNEGEEVPVYQPVIDAGHVRLAIKPVSPISPTEPEYPVKVEEKAAESIDSASNVIDNSGEDTLNEVSTASSTRETTSRSWADMAEENDSTLDINELPSLDEMDEDQGALEAAGKKKRADKLNRRKNRKVEIVSHDDECFD